MATTVGLVHLEFHVPQTTSLKDKRRAVKSFKDRLANRYNVSVAEVDAQDDRRRAILAAAVVAGEKHYLQGVVQKIVNDARLDREMVLTAHEVEWL